MASEADDVHMRDAEPNSEAVEEEHQQYGHGPLTETELDEKYSFAIHWTCILATD